MYEDNYANRHLKSQFYVYGIETLMGNEFQRNADREMDDGNGWCACPVESTTDCSLSLLSVSFSGRGRTLYNSFRVLVAETSDPASGSHISLSLSFPKPRPCVHTHTSRRTFFRPTSLFYATFRFSLLCVFHPTLPHQWMKILKMAVAGRRRRNSPSFPAAPSEFSTWPHTNI